MMTKKIEYLSTERLKPYSRNARKHSAKQVRQIAASIETFGFTNPILTDENGLILAGHGRVQAAKQLGLRVVPCVFLGGLTEVEKRAYILADNKLAENAIWDYDLLADELEFLVEHTDKIDVGLTGFAIEEIDSILEPGGTTSDAERETDDQLPEPSETATSVTRLGDVWQLGPHRLICGDARDVNVYRRLMSKAASSADDASDRHQIEFADMVFTDPPYNVQIDGNVCGLGKVQHREFAHASGEMSPRQFAEFLTAALSQLAQFSKSGSIHFVCMDWRHIGELLEAGAATYSELKNLVVWVKDNGGMGTFYRSRHELIFAFKNGEAPHINTFKLGQFGRYRTNVWNYPGVSSGSATARAELQLHPTVKPVAMLADALKDCSPRGGIVLDAFAGSGSILIAAQKTGRRARAIEIDPAYCDVAVRRWQTYAKDEAVLASSAQSFSEVEIRRSGEPNSGDVIRRATVTIKMPIDGAPSE